MDSKDDLGTEFAGATGMDDVRSGSFSFVCIDDGRALSHNIGYKRRLEEVAGA